MDTNRKGRYAEIKAQLWLVEQGFEVLANVMPVGFIDIVTMDRDTGQMIPIDVKTGTLTDYGTRKIYRFDRLKKDQQAAGVQILMYMPDEDDFVFIEPHKARSGKQKKTYTLEAVTASLGDDETLEVVRPA